MSDHPGLAGADAPDASDEAAGGRAPARPREATSARDRAERHARSLILAGVARDARLDAKFLLLLVLSTAIATLGLLQNSTVVVIGAMLVSPLLGPIMGIGFALATIDSRLMRRSLLTLAAGVVVAIIVAALMIWLSPIADVTDELRARTQPTLLDLAVAVVGGIAGVFAIMRKLSGVMVGVAIATTLLPPLSTIAFGLVTGRPDFALGAALLFLTNSLAIAFVATAVARLNRFGPSLTPQHSALQAVGIVATLGVLSIPLALSLDAIVREVAARAIVQSALAELAGRAARVDELSVRVEGDVVRVDGVLLVARYDPGLDAGLRRAVAARLDRPVAVSLVQLRQQTGAAQQQENQFARRLTALERRDAETGALLRELGEGGLVDRAAITLDPQARRILVARDRAAEEPAAAAAIDRVVAAARAAHPEWIIAEAAVTAPAPEEPAR